MLLISSCIDHGSNVKKKVGIIVGSVLPTGMLILAVALVLHIWMKKHQTAGNSFTYIYELNLFPLIFLEWKITRIFGTQVKADMISNWPSSAAWLKNLENFECHLMNPTSENFGKGLPSLTELKQKKVLVDQLECF